VEPDVGSTTQQTNAVKERKLMALTPDEIRAIYAKRRTKGVYDSKLVAFLDSGEEGVNVRETWPNDFPYPGKDAQDKPTGKKATSIKQGFENSKGRKESPDGSATVDVIVDGEEVYLINTVLSGMAEELAEATA